MILKFLHDLAMGTAPMVGNHVWQSTLFAMAAGALTLAFRRNQARVRFGIWLAASIKFLIPFSLLISLGSHLGTANGPVNTQTALNVAVEQVSQPFTHAMPAAVVPVDRMEYLVSLLPEALAAVWLLGFGAVIGQWCVRWWRILAATRGAATLGQGREMDALRELERMGGISKPIPLLVSRESMEPGIFGIVRPVLIWPEGISEHLDDAHLKAILAHEVWHVRRRDNLAAALHMLVEAAFWFHPLVWWLGARLMDERERACDEEVLGLGNEPEVYAESILKACKFCVESPLSCVSGVAGSDLKRRILRIMNRQLGSKLSIGSKVLLAAIGMAAVCAPVAIGIFNPSQVHAQAPGTTGAALPAFDAVSVKPSTAADKNTQVEIQPNGFTETNTTVKTLIEFAYGVKDYQLAGAPDWINSDRYDVEISWKASPETESTTLAETVPPPPAPEPPPGEPVTFIRVSQAHGVMRPGLAQAMVKKLLAERFNLKLTHESRDLPVYDLVVASTGSKLTETPAAALAPVTPDGKSMISVRETSNNATAEVSLKNGSVAALAALLSEQLDLQVLDKTGLKGHYDMTLQWSPGENAKNSAAASLEDQLGLKLEAQHGPVDVLLIDQVEKPAEND